MTKTKAGGGADGMRRRFRSALDPRRFEYPRRTALNHRIGWYLDGSGPSRRPVFGIYALASFAEYVLHFARFGKRTQRTALPVAARFFAETRREVQNVLSTYHIDKKVPASGVAHLRDVVARLVEHGRAAYEAVTRPGCPSCPACGGRRLSAADGELLEAILYEQSRNGTIPPDSKLFRKTHLTAHTGV